MDYKMFKPDGGIDANTNVVSLIKESLGKDGLTLGSSLRFIGFEAEPGTEFYLNGTKDSNKMEVPSTGKFITPFDGQRGCNIYYLAFEESFDSPIYYII